MLDSSRANVHQFGFSNNAMNRILVYYSRFRSRSGRAGIEFLLYRIIRNFLIRRRRRRTIPRWTVNYGTKYRITGNTRKFNKVVEQTFAILGLPNHTPHASILASTLVDLSREPSHASTADQTWCSVLGNIPFRNLSRWQWRQLKQISGMMGLFNAALVAHNASLELAMQYPTNSEYSKIEQITALLQTGNYSQANELINETSKHSEVRESTTNDSVLGLSHILRISDVERSESLVSKYTYLQRLNSIVGNKRVGIIGNGLDMVNSEISEIDVLVRLNAFTIANLDISHLRSDFPLVIYMNSSESIRFFRELSSGTNQAKAIDENATIMMLRVNNDSGNNEKYVVPKLAAPVHDHGPILGMQALFDICLSGAKSIKLFCFDFNQTSLFSEPKWEMCRKLGDQGILSQFEFAKRLSERAVIMKDKTTESALRHSPAYFAQLLCTKFGDWSV